MAWTKSAKPNKAMYPLVLHHSGLRFCDGEAATKKSQNFPTFRSLGHGILKHVQQAPLSTCHADFCI
jgi:hypothetical protein